MKLIFGEHTTEKNALDLISEIRDLDILYHESLNNIQEQYDKVKQIVGNRHKKSPDDTWSELNTILGNDFWITFYEKVVFDKDLSNLKIKLQENVPPDRWNIEYSRLEIKRYYKAGTLSYAEAIEKLIPLYQYLIGLEVKREFGVISGLEKLTKEFHNSRIGLFMGSDHSLSIQHLCRTKKIAFELVELAEHKYYSESIGNLKKHCMETSTITYKNIENFVEKYLQDN